MVIGGMIVGFDHDGPDIFARQFDFAMSSAIPILTLGALVAPAATPLHERMRLEGRLTADGSEIAAAPWATNIVPKRMTRDELLTGIQWLANRLYEPAAFAERVLAFTKRFGERLDPRHTGREEYGLRTRRSVEKDAHAIIKTLTTLGPEESKMMYAIFGAISKKPRSLEPVASALLQYAQIRFMYERGRLWEGLPERRAVSAGAL